MSQESSDSCDSWLVPFDDLLPDIGMYVADISDDLGKFALRATAHDFLSRTHHAQIEFILPLQAGVRVYELPIPDGFKYQAVVSTKTTTGGRVPITADMDGWISINAPVGGSFLELVCKVALRPGRNITGVPKETAEEWGEILSYGAVARLLAMPDQTWANATQSVLFDRKYNVGVTRARIRNARGTQPGSIPMRAERWV